MYNDDSEGLSEQELLSLLAQITKEAGYMDDSDRPESSWDDSRAEEENFQGLSDKAINLFVEVLASILTAADYSEYLDSGRSMILDYLRANDVDEDEALEILATMGKMEGMASGIYLSCLEALDYESLFDQWCQLPDSFIKAQKLMLDSIELKAQKPDLLSEQELNPLH